VAEEGLDLLLSDAMVAGADDLRAVLAGGARVGPLRRGAGAARRTRDWLAWAVAVFLTAAVWGWHLHDLSRQTGVNIGLGTIMMLVAPLLISGFSVATAGMRGKIPDWGQEPDS